MRPEQRVMSENPVTLKAAPRPGRQAEEQAATGQAEGKGRSGFFGAPGRRPGQEAGAGPGSGGGERGRKDALGQRRRGGHGAREPTPSATDRGASPDSARRRSADPCAGRHLPTLTERSRAPCRLPERTWPLPDAELLGVASGLGSGRRNGKGPGEQSRPPTTQGGRPHPIVAAFSPWGARRQ